MDKFYYKTDNNNELTPEENSIMEKIGIQQFMSWRQVMVVTFKYLMNEIDNLKTEIKNAKMSKS